MLRAAVMVVEVRLAGLTEGIRVATVPVRSRSELLGADRDALPYLVAEPVVDSEIVLGNGDSSARSLSFTLDADAIDVATIIRTGGGLCGVAEVALEIAGIANDYDQRLIILRGDVSSGVRFGARGADGRQVIDLEIVDPKESLTTRLPPWVIGGDSGRFGSAHITAIGDRVPLVINGYTHIPAVRVTSNTVGSNDFVFAAGHGWTVNTSTGVIVDGVVRGSADAVYGWTLLEDTDATGLAYSAIRFTVGATSWPDGATVYVTASSGEALDPIGVLQRVLEKHSAVGLDGLQSSMVAEARAGMPVRDAPDVMVNASSGPADQPVLDWLEGGFLASFPMLGMAFWGGGYGPVLLDWRRTQTAQWEAEAYPLIYRSSLVQETPKSEVFNSFVVRYGYDPLLDTWDSVITADPDTSDLCRYSRQLYQERHAPQIESPYIQTEGQARYVLEWLVAHFATPAYVVEYEAAAVVFLQHRVGDTISLTDPDFSWSGEPAIIEALSYQRGLCTVRLRVFVRAVQLGGQAQSVPVIG